MSEAIFQTVRGSTPVEFITKVQQDAKVMSSITAIVEKMEGDGFIRILYESFKMIMTSETRSTEQEVSQLACKGPMSANTIVISNLYIFKENLKAVSTFISGLISRTIVEGEDKVRSQ